MTLTPKIASFGGAALVLLAGALWLLIPTPTHAPSEVGSVASSTLSTATSTSSGEKTSSPTSGAFPINSHDSITSWSFTGAYATNPALTEQATTDSAKLKALIAGGGSPDYDTYDLYVGIGNDADLLGDGKAAYRAYNQAIAIHPKKGLGYVNIAHLMTELKAYYTAADAYAKAVAVEPGMLEYHVERLNFLRQQFGSNQDMMLAGFADASRQFGDVAQVLVVEATWLTDQGRYADAIAAWQRAKTLSPGRDTSAMDAEIARLQSKL